MRVALLALAACGGGAAVVDPMPVCPAGPVWNAQGCRVDRVVGDLAIHVVPEATAVRISVTAHGKPVTYSIARNPGHAAHGAVVTLASVAPDHARAIAAVLVGDDRVQCEARVTGCAPPDGAGAWILDASRAQISPDLDGIYHYTPRWKLGSPVAAGVTAIVLDDIAPRAMPLLTWSDLALGGKQLAIIDARAMPNLLASCAGYQVLGSDETLAIVDEAASRWSWISVNPARRPPDPITCTDGVVSIARDPLTLAIRADTGVFVALGATDLAAVVGDLHALLDTPRSLPACRDPAPFAGHVPCTRAGTDEGHAWSIVPRVAGDHAIAWRIELAGQDPVVIGDRAFRAVKLAFPIAHALAGEVTCMTPRRSCGEVDALVRWMFARPFGHRFDDRGTVELEWQSGVPVLPPPGIAIVPYDPIAGTDGEVALAYDLARDGALQSSPCGARAIVWWTRSTGAISDGQRWAWLYVAPDDPITAGTCRDGLARFTHADNTITVVDPATGAWHTE